MVRRPIVFDFVRGRAYRAAGTADDLVNDVKKRVKKPRIVKTVEGIRPGVVQQPET